MQPGSHATSLVDSTKDNDIEDDDFANDDVMEVLAKSAEVQLYMYVKNMYEKSLTSLVLALEQLGKDWILPIYVFFNCVPHIEHINGRCVHVFICAASHCKGRNDCDVCCFLDTDDAKSTSGLCQHVKMCWGDEAVNAAGGTKDLEGMCKVLAKTWIKHNESKTIAFARIYKEKVTYSHCQYIYTETRYVVMLLTQLTSESNSESKLSAGLLRTNAPLQL